MDARYVEFQSTHPRGVRHPPPQGTRHPHAVSIHAPAWGATAAHGSRQCRRNGFNPRTRVGCDVDFRRRGSYLKSFNPRTRVGCDAYAGAVLVCGARFNPRTRVGCDPISATLSFAANVFQSTHPRGVRPDGHGGRAPSPSGFNPRTRVGCDLGQPLDLGSQRPVSIHAPAWGATRMAEHRSRKYAVSIHAPAWGATSVRPLCPGPAACFNPRTRVGCDERATSARSMTMWFQSTHPRGVRPHLTRRTP